MDKIEETIKDMESQIVEFEREKGKIYKTLKIIQDAIDNIELQKKLLQKTKDPQDSKTIYDIILKNKQTQPTPEFKKKPKIAETPQEKKEEPKKDDGLSWWWWSNNAAAPVDNKPRKNSQELESEPYVMLKEPILIKEQEPKK